MNNERMKEVVTSFQTIKRIVTNIMNSNDKKILLQEFM